MTNKIVKRLTINFLLVVPYEERPLKAPQKNLPRKKIQGFAGLSSNPRLHTGVNRVTVR